MKIYQYPYSVKLASDMKINGSATVAIGTVQACCRGTAANIAWTQMQKAHPFIFQFDLDMTLGKGKFLGNESETLESGRRQFAALQS